MATDIISRFPRRDMLKAIAGGFVAARAGAEIADPVAELGRRWRVLFAAANAATGDAAMEAWDRVGEIETEMSAIVATTPAGILAQAEVLRDFIATEEYEQTLKQIIAGLRRLAA